MKNIIKITTTKNCVSPRVNNLKTDLGIIINSEKNRKLFIKEFKKELESYGYCNDMIKEQVSILEFEIRQNCQKIIDAIFFFRKKLDKDLIFTIEELNYEPNV